MSEARGLLQLAPRELAVELLDERQDMLGNLRGDLRGRGTAQVGGRRLPPHGERAHEN